MSVEVQAVVVVVFVRAPACVGAVVRRIAIAVIRLIAVDDRLTPPTGIRRDGHDNCREGYGARHGEGGLALPHGWSRLREKTMGVTIIAYAGQASV